MTLSKVYDGDFLRNSLILLAANHLKYAEYASDVVKKVLILQCITSQNGKIHFKNLQVNASRFLKYVWPFWVVIY